MKNLSLGTELLQKYIFYKNKRKELQDYINMEIQFWGNYNLIPESMKRDIDIRVNDLCRFETEINVKAIEDKLLKRKDFRENLHLYSS